VPYALALGGTREQVGVMHALPLLLGTPFQLVGAWLAERFPYAKRWIFVLTGGTMGGLALLGYALIPAMGLGAYAIWLLIALYAWASIWGQMGLPAWNVLFTRAMSRPIWGRFWADYNIATSLVAIVATAGASLLIRRLGEPTGYQAGALVSSAVNLCSLYVVLRIPEAQLADQEKDGSAGWRTEGGFARVLRSDRDFLGFCLVGGLLHLAGNLTIPQLPVFWVQTLQATPGVVGLLNAVGVATALAGWRFYGPRVDRGSPKRIMVASGLWSAAMTLPWLLARQTWHAFPLRVLSTLAAMGWTTASFSFIRAMAPPHRLASYLALQGLFLGLPGFVGALLSGVISARLGFGALFAVAAALSFCSVGAFARWVGDPFQTGNGPRASMAPSG